MRLSNMYEVVNIGKIVVEIVDDTVSVILLFDITRFKFGGSTSLSKRATDNLICNL